VKLYCTTPRPSTAYAQPGRRHDAGEVIVFLVQDAEPVGRRWLANLVRNLDDERGRGFSRILPRPDAGPLVKRGCEGDLCFGSQRIEARIAPGEHLDPHALRVRSNFNDVSSALRRSAWEALPFVRGMFGEDIKFARAAGRGLTSPDPPARCCTATSTTRARSTSAPTWTPS
jgi:hypothetical protein